VAVYSTFLARAFDQAYYDVGLHRLPVTLVLDRAGITGDDGASHHGVLDMALCLSIPNMTVFAPSSVDEVATMLTTATQLDGPASIRFPKTAPVELDGQVGEGLSARVLREGDGSVCLIGVGKMAQRCLSAASLLEAEGIAATVYDPRVISPPDRTMLADALRHQLIVTVEDGARVGGAGSFLLDAVQQLAAEQAVPMPQVRVLGTPREFLAHGRPDQILADLGLDDIGVKMTVERALRIEPEPSAADSSPESEITRP
jgi:1-deoxy-D-xylulose-5-phosphate synthase